MTTAPFRWIDTHPTAAIVVCAVLFAGVIASGIAHYREWRRRQAMDAIRWKPRRLRLR